MTKVVEAIYTEGCLRPVETLDLPEKQRVRLAVEPVEDKAPKDRDAILKRLFDSMDRMNFHLRGPMPTRDELHDRR